MVSTGKYRAGQTQTRQQRQHQVDVGIRVVEGDVKQAPTARDHLPPAGRTVTAAQEVLYLSLQLSLPDGEWVIPTITHGVVAKNNRTKGVQH
jgi:hypothetical protein